MQYQLNYSMNYVLFQQVFSNTATVYIGSLQSQV